MDMKVNMESPPVLHILKTLYKDAQRASNVGKEVMGIFSLSYEDFQAILLQLVRQNVIENIEKNKSNGDAVYKLTRAGEKILERKAHAMYGCSCGCENRKGEFAC